MNDTVLRIAFPGVLFVFAASIVVQAVQMTGPLAESNAHLYPMVIAGLLAVGALGSMIGAMRGSDGPADATPAAASRAAPESTSALGDDNALLTAEETEQAADRGGRTRVLVVLVASVVYPLIMPVVGFHIATTLYASGLSLLLQERSLKGAGWAVATGLGVTMFCHLAFVVLLDARLPTASVL